MSKIQQRSEQLVINAILNEPSCIHDVMSTISSDMFQFPDNKLIFEAISFLYLSQEPVGLITVFKQLNKSKSMNKQQALGELSNIYSMFSAGDRFEVGTAVRFLLSESVRHEHIDFAKKMGDISVSDDYEPSTIIDMMQSHILDNKLKKIVNKKEMTNEDLINELDKKMLESATHSGISGIKTGIDRFDRVTSGMQPTNFIIVAARPALGKTAFALSIMRNASIKDNKKGLFISCEMDEVQLMKRIIAIDSGVSGNSLKRGNLTPSERGRYERSRKRIINSGVKIVAGTFTIADVLSLIYKLKHSQGLDYVVIDYIQKITSPNAQNRTNEVGDVSRKLKDAANDLKIPIIALAQLSRAVEHRVDKKPQLSDLRESGDIEQDADIVTFLYRPSYYMSIEEREMNPLADDGYLVIAKHRDGELEDIHLKFDGNIPAWKNPNERDDYTDEYVQTAMSPNIDF